MPNCFQLRKKGEKEPSTFYSIDEALCAHLGVKPQTTRWYANWRNSIGLGLACGWTLDSPEMLAECERQDVIEREIDPDRPELLVLVLKFLQEYYASDAWYERKKH